MDKEKERQAPLVNDLAEEVNPSPSLCTLLFLGCSASGLTFLLDVLQNGLNALHLAAKEGHMDLVQELLDRGAAVDSATKVRYASFLLSKVKILKRRP